MGSELEVYQRVIAGNVLDFALWGGLIGRLTWGIMGDGQRKVLSLGGTCDAAQVAEKKKIIAAASVPIKVGSLGY